MFASVGNVPLGRPTYGISQTKCIQPVSKKSSSVHETRLVIISQASKSHIIEAEDIIYGQLQLFNSDKGEDVEAVQGFSSDLSSNGFRTAAKEDNNVPSTSYSTVGDTKELARTILATGSNYWKSTHAHSPRAPEDIIYSETKNEDIARLIVELAHAGAFKNALRFIDDTCRLPEPMLSHRKGLLYRINDAQFTAAAKLYKASKEALQYLLLMPEDTGRRAKLYNLVLDVCASARDLPTALVVVEQAEKEGLELDLLHYTTLIKVCKSVGNVNYSFRIFADLKVRKLKPDGVCYGALLAACAEAINRELTIAHERKEQFLLVERAFNLVDEAVSSGVRLEAAAWNALLVCVGRGGALSRTQEVLDRMQAQGVVPDQYTYSTLVEAYVQAAQPENAIKLLTRAESMGPHAQSLQLFTSAISACKISKQPNFEQAYKIYEAAIKRGFVPDRKMYAALAAVAGAAGNLEDAFRVLCEMADRGLPPSATTCSALLSACLKNKNLDLAKEVYERHRAHGIYPVLAHFNNLMEAYATAFRLGDVISLATDMLTNTRLRPNLNTYRILLSACQRTDQTELAFEIYSILKQYGIRVLQQKFGRALCHTLVKMCFNRIRFSWTAAGYPKNATTSTPAGPAPKYSAMRQAQTLKFLELLADKLPAPKPGSRPLPRGSLILEPPDSINWTTKALWVYRDVINSGFRPKLETLDVLLNCLRLKMPDKLDQAGTNMSGSKIYGVRSIRRPAAHPFERHMGHMEVAFDRRALNLVEEAISYGNLAPIKFDEPMTVDMRNTPPIVAEVYVQLILQASESRYKNWQANKGKVNPPQKAVFLHPISFQCGAFDSDLALFPSSVKPYARFLRDSLWADELESRKRKAARALLRSQQEQAAAETLLKLPDQSVPARHVAAELLMQHQHDQEPILVGHAAAESKLSLHEPVSRADHLSVALLEREAKPLVVEHAMAGALVQAAAAGIVNGNGLSVNGNGLSGNGNGLSVNGNGLSGNGNGLSSNGNGLSSNGNGLSSNGNGLSSNGNGLSVNGNGLSVNGNGLSHGDLSGHYDGLHMSNGSSDSDSASSDEEAKVPESNDALEDGGDNTALAIIGAMRRMKVWYQTDLRKGVISIRPRQLHLWVVRKERYEANLQHEAEVGNRMINSFLNPQQEHLISDQQRLIRMGGVLPLLSDKLGGGSANGYSHLRQPSGLPMSSMGMYGLGGPSTEASLRNGQV